MITAFLLVRCEPQRIHGLGRSLADLPGIAEVYTTTGEVDFIAVVRVEDLEALASLVTEGVATLEGVLGTDTHLAMRSYGRTDTQAAFDIGLD